MANKDKEPDFCFCQSHTDSNLYTHIYIPIKIQSILVISQSFFSCPLFLKISPKRDLWCFSTFLSSKCCCNVEYYCQKKDKKKRAENEVHVFRHEPSKLIGARYTDIGALRGCGVPDFPLCPGSSITEGRRLQDNVFWGVMKSSFFFYLAFLKRRASERSERNSFFTFSKGKKERL